METRPYAQAGTGIGLGSTVPPERVQPAPPASGPRGLPKSSEGPGVFTGGSYTKCVRFNSVVRVRLLNFLLSHRYAELLQEWQTGRQVTSCVKGKWEDAYAEMHHEVSDSLTSERYELTCSTIDDDWTTASKIAGIPLRRVTWLWWFGR